VTRLQIMGAYTKDTGTDLGQTADWRDALVTDQVAVFPGLEQRLGDQADLLALVAAKDEAELRRQRDAAQELADERESISNEIVKIETSIAQAREGNELDAARARAGDCRELLEQRFEQECFSTAARLLLDDVEQQHVDANRPEVLRRAEEWFARFTRNAFTLRSHAPRSGTFLARENSSGEDRTPLQLSSGTRMQLFLALRLAFALDAERNRESLPFFLDEALTISDPERFGSIVDCLHAFAREQDRQVFYLTAQPHDVRVWSGLDPQPKQIKLHEVRDLGASLQEPADLELRPIEEIPSSAGLTPEEYGQRLQVPRVELWNAATMVHLFHALSPAPSWAALGWLETSIRSYAKYVDVAARATASDAGETGVMRRDR
jgi:exonuclease SbcC